jgi:hypothetical protein
MKIKYVQRIENQRQLKTELNSRKYISSKHFIRFKAHTALNMMIAALWVVAPYRLYEFTRETIIFKVSKNLHVI